MKQSIILVVAILMGLVFPFFSVFSPILPYLLGIMMFFSFIKANISFRIFSNIRVYLILLANIAIGWIFYFLLSPMGHNIAFSGFLVGMIPTALASPAVMLVLGGNVEFVIASVIVTNIGIGISLPFFSLLISPVEISIHTMLVKTIMLLFIPFIFSLFIKGKTVFLYNKIKNFSFVVFYVWASLIIISMAKTSIMLRENWEMYSDYIFPIAFFTGVICIVNFVVGYFIGGKNFSKEASQALGQKNPIIMIWIALEFFTPFFTLGPIFYMFFHNIVNAWKMMKYRNIRKNTLLSEN